MPDPKPTITPEHHERFAAIMKTPTRPNVPADSSAPTPSKISAVLSSLPKPKGVGNKMFIFTGKKKIVLEPGGKQEVETVKTVDAKTPEKKPEVVKSEAKPEEIKAQTTSPQTTTQPVLGTVKQETKTDKKAQPKSSKMGIFIIVLIVVLGAWTLFWLYFLDFI